MKKAIISMLTCSIILISCDNKSEVETINNEPVSLNITVQEETNRETSVENTSDEVVEYFGGATARIFTQEEPKDIGDSSLKLDASKSWVYKADYPYNVDEETFSIKNHHGVVSDELVTVKNHIAPYINIDSEDAKQANEEIEKIFYERVEIYKRAYKEKFQNWSRNDYYVEFNEVNNLLSVEIEYITGATAYPSYMYKGYVFDLNTGKRISLHDLCSLLNIKDFETKAKEQIKLHEFLDENHGTEEDDIVKSLVEFEEKYNKETIEFWIKNSTTLEFSTTVYNKWVEAGNFVVTFSVE